MLHPKIMRLSFCLSGSEELLSALSFIICQRLLLNLLLLCGNLLFELLGLLFSDTSFLGELEFQASIDLRLCVGSGLLDGVGYGGGGCGRSVGNSAADQVCDVRGSRRCASESMNHRFGCGSHRKIDGAGGSEEVG